VGERTEVSALLRPLLDMPRRLEVPLVDGDLMLRLPRMEDRHVLTAYTSDPSSLEGAWLPVGIPDTDHEAVGAWLAREFVLGWSPIGGRYGGVLVMDLADISFAGLIFLGRLAPAVAEISYGVAPRHRGQGLATKATVLATDWALSDGGFERVEARIDRKHAESMRVVTKAGFRHEEDFKTYVEGTGKTAEDSLFVRP
jgi:RimJ/RimL family protein N-acetyltransferase